MRRYTILRDVGSSPTFDPFNKSLRGPSRIAGPPVSRAKVETAELSKRDVRDIVRDPTVTGVAPIMPTKLIKLVASESTVQHAWGIEAVLAHNSPYTGTGVVVSVLDTGIDSTHPAFQGIQLIQEDFSGSGNGDLQGHGTHCAGTIFGRDVDGVRIGVARGVQRALIGKVLNDEGRGDSDMLFRGMQWASQEGANIISMSLGFDFPGYVEYLHQVEGWPIPAATSAALEAYRANIRMFDTLMELIRYSAAFGRGTVVVAASGNESNRDGYPPYEIAVSVPAAAEGVLAVGAAAQGANGYTIASFSNTLPQLCAPGVDVLSARAGGGLVSASGTSMATPHVAGVAALWWEARSTLPSNATAAAVMAELIASARDNVFESGTDSADFGFGMVMAPLSTSM